MYVPPSPTFKPRWLRLTLPQPPDWLTGPEWVPPGEKAVYTNARSGLYVVLEALDEGSVALVPEYLPSGVVRAFYHAGFDVHYYPVDDDLTIPMGTVGERLWTLAPDVVLFVHYFGFADPAFDALAETARDVGSFVIEDAARGLFSRTAEGRLLGTSGDAAIFSLYKVLPVPDGGLVVAPGLEFPDPRTDASMGRGLFGSLANAGARTVGWAPSSRADRHLDLRSVDFEADAANRKLDRPPVGPSRLTRLGLSECSPPAIRAARRARYARFRERLRDIDAVSVLTPPLSDGACPYGVVVSVRAGREACTDLFATLRRDRLPVEAFRWPIGFPPDRLAEFPGALALRFSTLIFPTHQQLPADVVDDIAKTIVTSC